MKTTYPNLYEFFAGYFHPDWPEESLTATGVVERYLSEFPRDEVREASRELRNLLINAPVEDDLSRIVNQLGSYYNPQADGLTYRGWLLQVCALLEGEPMS
ncbi:contact-dependent growth inhibition system immunity protein [[Empedobacter] haloabium]|uniref:Contact-dependent growth inhibition system immunity protein n=1 Tax=[Empedobacter] haloabium TaxID=592317 RepID=A0ABZ1UQN4_9BURK